MWAVIRLETRVPRPREFDEIQALEAAIDCFWRSGLNATSVRDLAGHMGINGPSLYNAFGDKRALFAQALDRYVETRVRVRLAALEAIPSADAALHAFFADQVERAVADPGDCGCLVVNAALALGPDDQDLRPAISGYLSEIEGFFERLLRRISDSAKPEAAALAPETGARLLMSTLITLRVLARLQPERATLEAAVAAALDATHPHPSTRRSQR